MSTDAWGVYDYELWMLGKLKESEAEFSQYAPHIQNAIVESRLLHLRILVDILASRDNNKDAVRLDKLLPSSFQSENIQKLKDCYGTRYDETSPCFILNKMLAHATDKRSAVEHSYHEVMNRLAPHIKALVEEVHQARPNPPAISPGIYSFLLSADMRTQSGPEIRPKTGHVEQNE